MEKLPKTATKEITIKELNYQMMLNIPPRPNKPMSTPIKSKKANSMKEKSVALRYPPSQMLQNGWLTHKESKRISIQNHSQNLAMKKPFVKHINDRQ